MSTPNHSSLPFLPSVLSGPRRVIGKRSLTAKPRAGLAVFLIACSVACAVGDSTENTTLPALHAEQDLRVGSVDDETTALTYFRELAVAPDGRIYTLHRQENTIRVHDASGGFVRTIGRAGEGPGEFSGILDLGIRGDTLWVFDSDMYRFSLFDLGGELIGTREFRVDIGDATRNPPRPEGLLHDGTVWGSTRAWPEEVADGTLTESALVRFDSAGAVVDTIAVKRLEGSVWRLAESGGDGFRSYRAQPFEETQILELAEHAAELITVDRAVSAAAPTPTFRVTKSTFGGDTLFTRTFTYVRKPIAEWLPDSLAREFAGFLRELPPQFQAGVPTFARGVELARETLHLPAHHPPVRRLLPGLDGTIWLAREDDGADMVAWWVLDRTGEPIGEVMLPRGLQVLAADASHVWGMEGDELDVPYLVRYGIRPGTAGT